MSLVQRYVGPQIPRCGIDSIKAWEKCRVKAYRDSGGVPTIGWGHTSGVQMGMTWTQAQCDQVFEQELTSFWKSVFSLIKDVYTTNGQAGAMLSLAYNIGVHGFQNSSVLRHHRKMEYLLAADSFLLWVKDDGNFIQGLYNRRVSERNLYRTSP